MSPMPDQKPGRSKQNFATPETFLAAVKHKLGITAFALDLAAEGENTVAEHWYDQELNALIQTWDYGPAESWNWLNPEFGDIAPWVKRAWTELQRAGARTAVLVPAGVGSNWWRDWVHEKALVLLLNGRLCFIKDWATTIDPATLKPGKGPPHYYTSAPLYPKDCCLLLYSATPPIPLHPTSGYQVWEWREEIPR